MMIKVLAVSSQLIKHMQEVWCCSSCKEGAEEPVIWEEQRQECVSAQRCSLIYAPAEHWLTRLHSSDCYTRHSTHKTTPALR